LDLESRFTESLAAAVETEGEVRKSDRAYTLSKDSALLWTAQSGAQFGIEIDLDWEEFQIEAPSELTLVFVPQGLSQWGLSSLGAGRPCGLAMRCLQRDGRFQWEVTLRTFRNSTRPHEILTRRIVDAETFPSSLRITYNYGVISLILGDDVLQADVDNFCAGVETIHVRNLGLPVTLSNLRGRSSPRPAVPPLLERLRLISAAAADHQSSQLQDANDFAGAIPVQNNVYDICRSVLGDRHLYSIRSGTSLAGLHRLTGEFATAIELLDRIESAARAEYGTNHPETATLIEERALVAVASGDWPSADPLLREAHAIRRRESDQPHDQFLEEVAGDLESLGDWAPSIALRERVVECCRSAYAADHWRPLESRVQLANALHRRGMASEQRNELIEARKKADRAIALLDKGQLPDALADAQASLEVRTRLLGVNHRDTAQVHTTLGLIYKKMGRLDDAQRHYELDLEITRAVQGERHPEYATVLANMAGLWKEREQNARAEELYLAALDIRRQNTDVDPKKYADSLDEVGRLYAFSLGKFEKGLPLIEEAYRFRLTRFASDSLEVSRSLSNLGYIHDAIGDYARAIACFQESLAIKKKFLGEEDATHATLLVSLGTAEGSADRPDDALRHIQQAVDIVVKLAGTDNAYYPQFVNFLAGALADVGRMDEARARYEEALAIRSGQVGPDHLNCGDIYINLASLSLRQGQFDQALAESEKAMRIVEAAIGRDNKNFRACESLQVAASIATGERLDQALEKNGRLLAHAEDEMRRRMPVLSETQQLTHLQSVRRLLFRQLEIGRRVEADPALLHQHVMTWKSAIGVRAMTDKLDQSGDLADLRRQLGDVRARMSAFVFSEEARLPADASSGLNRLEAEKERLQRQLAQAVADRNGIQASPRSVSEALPPDHALVDFIRVDRTKGGPCYFAFVIRSSEADGAWIEWFELGTAGEIDQSVLDWRRSITAGSDDPSMAAALRRRLWEPLESLSDSPPAAILLCLDGALTAVPWNALPGSEPGTFLIEETLLYSLPFAQVVLLSRSSLPANTTEDRVLLVGDLDYDAPLSAPSTDSLVLRAPSLGETENWTWAAIPAARAEIDAIQVLAGPRKVVALRHDKASPGATVTALREARFAHFASHGFFATGNRPDQAESGAWTGTLARNPYLLSGVVLSGANQDARAGQPLFRGVLTAEAITSLPLDGLELVTLSACETGLGEVAGGEGVYGLQRSFHLAGARFVVASLWRVEDDATAALMKLIYHYLWDQGLSPPEALRMAQRTLLRQPSMVTDSTELATALLRGPQVKNPVKLPEKKPPADSSVAPIRQWAAFSISGR
jgi:CHAT domain-containing protein/tetratricopeptide (TPR) repeat protein